jgi:hypothetical protein
MKNSNDNVGDRTRDLPACSAVPYNAGNFLTIRGGVTFSGRTLLPGVTMAINIFSHNQDTVYEKFYYVTTSFDPKLGSSADQDTSVGKYIEELISWRSSPVTLKLNIFKMYVYKGNTGKINHNKA